VPRQESQIFLSAMDRRRQPKDQWERELEFLNQLERSTNRNIGISRDSGRISSEGVRGVGKAFWDQAGDLGKEYMDAKNWRQKYDSGQIDLKSKNRQDQWMQKQGRAATSSEEEVAGPSASLMNTSANPGASSSVSSAEPSSFSEEDLLRTPDRNYSPGAADVIDKKAQPGFNPGVPINPGMKRDIPAAQSQPRTMSDAPAATMPVGREIAMSEEYQPAPKVMRRVQTPSMTREEMLWQAGIDKNVADALNAQGIADKNVNWREITPKEREEMDLRRRQQDHIEGQWKDSGYTTTDGQMIMINPKGETKVGPKVDKLFPPMRGGAGGITPYQQHQIQRQRELDAQRAEDKKAARDEKKEKQLNTAAEKISVRVEKSGLPEMRTNMEEVLRLLPKEGDDIPGFGQTGFLPKYMLSQEGKNLRSALSSLFNAKLSARSGAAVTEQELRRLKDEFGDFSMASDKDLMNALRRLEAAMNKDIANMKAGYDPEALEIYTGRGGDDLSPIANPRSKESKTVTKKQYSPSRNQTRIIYSDGTEEVVDGQK
jgi:hypothetical protein